MRDVERIQMEIKKNLKVIFTCWVILKQLFSSVYRGSMECFPLEYAKPVE